MKIMAQKFGHRGMVHIDFQQVGDNGSHKAGWRKTICSKTKLNSLDDKVKVLK